MTAGTPTSAPSPAGSPAGAADDPARTALDLAAIAEALDPPARLDGTWESWFALDDLLGAARAAGLTSRDVLVVAPWIVRYAGDLLRRAWRETGLDPGASPSADRLRASALGYEIDLRVVLRFAMELEGPLPLADGATCRWQAPEIGPALLASWALEASWAVHPWSASPALDAAEAARRGASSIARVAPWLARQRAWAVASDAPHLASTAIALAAAMFRPPPGHPADPEGRGAIARTTRVAVDPSQRDAAMFLLRRWLVGADRAMSHTACEVLVALGFVPATTAEAAAMARRLGPGRVAYLPDAVARLLRQITAPPSHAKLVSWWLHMRTERARPTPSPGGPAPGDAPIVAIAEPVVADVALKPVATPARTPGPGAKPVGSGADLSAIDPRDKTANAQLWMRIQNDLDRRSDRAAEIGAELRVVLDRADLAEQVGRERAAAELRERAAELEAEREAIRAELEELRRQKEGCKARLEALGLVLPGGGGDVVAGALPIALAAIGMDVRLEAPRPADAPARPAPGGDAKAPGPGGGGALAALERALGGAARADAPDAPARKFGDAPPPPPGASPARQAPPGPPSRLGPYEVKGLLGEGGMGRVYRVHRASWGLDLALKVPRGKVDARVLGNLVREADAWASLGLHPHVTTCYFAERRDDSVWILSELVPGGSLDKLLDGDRLSEGDADLKRLLGIAWETAVGLHHAHERGLVHQDVKPSNVLLGKDGVAKVTDFGLARVATRSDGGQRKTLVAGFAGMTPAYCSPEQAAAASRRDATEPARITRRTDIWSWAAMVVESFIGRLTWQLGPQAGDALAAFRKAGLKAKNRPAMPVELADLLARCLRADEAERPATLREVADAIAEMEQARSGTARRAIATAASDGADELYNRGYSLVSLGLVARGEELLRDALRVDPLHIDAAFALAVTRKRSGAITTGEAVRRFEDVQQFVALRGESGGRAGSTRERATLLLAWLCAECGEHDVASKHLAVLDALGPREELVASEAELLRGHLHRARAAAGPAAAIVRQLEPVRPTATEELVVQQARFGQAIDAISTELRSGRAEPARVRLAELRREPAAARHPRTRALWSALADRAARGAPSAVWPVLEIDDPRGALRAIELSPRGEEVLALADGDRDVVVYDASSGRERERLVHDGVANAIALSLRGDVLVTAAECDVYVRRGTAGAAIARARLDEPIERLAVSANGRFVIALAAHRWSLLELVGNTLVRRATDRHARRLHRAALGATGADVVLATDGGTFRFAIAMPDEVYVVDGGAALDVVRPHATALDVIARADGRLVAMTAASPATQGPPAPLTGVAATYDGALAVTVDGAGIARVWTLADTRCIARLSGHDAAATDVAITPCGKTAASAGRDGRIQIWAIEWELETAAPITRIDADVAELLRRAAREGVTGSDMRRELSWAGHGAATDDALADAMRGG